MLHRLPWLLWLLPLAVTPARADDHGRARELLEHGRILPLEELLRGVPAIYRGRLLEAELEVEDGRVVYELELLRPDGTVWEIEVDAGTGKLLEVEREDD
jgi:uncharacterized membrane protein YkoI